MSFESPKLHLRNRNFRVSLNRLVRDNESEKIRGGKRSNSGFILKVDLIGSDHI